MSCFDLKGGIGTASRVVMPVDRRYAYDLRTDESGRPPAAPSYTVGVLALTNFGRLPRLTIDGVRVGQALIAEGLAEESTERERGSCVVVVATDAPLLPAALERLARRAGLGLARTGSSAGHGSGDIFLAFSTGLRIPRATGQPLRTFEVVDDEYLDPFFDAVVEATESAVVDSLFRAETVEGRDGNVVGALPVDAHARAPRGRREARMSLGPGSARRALASGRRRSPPRSARPPGPGPRSARSGRSCACSGWPVSTATAARWRAPSSTAGCAGSREGLGSGITLPFAMGLLEYDLDPQHLALDIASGTIDLALESELLLQPDRRAVAETEARRLAREALDRIDSDRIARQELTGLLGDATRPWIGVTMTETELAGALNEAAALVAAGADVLRVEVPIGRELADRLHDAGMEVREWRPSERRSTGGQARLEPAPTGSQRALAEVRRVADRLAAQRRAYVRIADRGPGAWAPEHAVVAAFERVDLVEVDPMAEIVAAGVDPDRTLSDHAFAYRLHRRAGTIVVVGAGLAGRRPGPAGRGPVRSGDPLGPCARPPAAGRRRSPSRRAWGRPRSR